MFWPAYRPEVVCTLFPTIRSHPCDSKHIVTAKRVKHCQANEQLDTVWWDEHK